jgi:hypothetical protein
MSALLAGLFAGAVHVWAGPDHLAAIAPLASQRLRRFWSLGVQWGIGHCLGVAVVALCAIWLRGAISPAVLSTWGEHAVGILLMAIGIRGLRKACCCQEQHHSHTQSGQTDAHVHLHGQQDVIVEKGQLCLVMATGVLHGLGGGAHFLGVLPALAFPSLDRAIAYLTGFAGGTICAMVVFGQVVGLLGRYSGLKGRKTRQGFMGITSLAATGVGLFWVTHS